MRRLHMVRHGHRINPLTRCLESPQRRRDGVLVAVLQVWSVVRSVQPQPMEVDRDERTICDGAVCGPFHVP